MRASRNSLANVMTPSLLIEMLSTPALVALAGILLVVLGTEMCGEDTNIFIVMGELIFEPRSIVDYVHIATSIYTIYRLSVFVRGCLPAVAAWVKQTWACLSAGAARRDTLVREQVIRAAWGFINALRSTTVAGILYWMLSCIVIPLLLLVVSPFVPAIRRKYFLWRNWVVDRFGEFVDWFCVDMEKRSDQRRARESRELQCGVQMNRLAKLNDDVARAYLNAANAWSDAHQWLAGKYENLRPTEFTGRVAIAVPEDGPVPPLGLWFRLYHRIDLRVYWCEQTIGRIDAAMAKNQVSIADLEHQLALRSQQIRAINDQVRECENSERTAFLQKIASKERQIAEVARIVTRRPEEWIREEDTTAAAAATTSTTLAVVDSPDTALIIAAAEGTQQYQRHLRQLSRDRAEAKRKDEEWARKEAADSPIRRQRAARSRQLKAVYRMRNPAPARDPPEAQRLAAAAETRRAAEAALESALAEESRLRAQWEAATAAVVDQLAAVESARAEEMRLLAELGMAPNDTAAVTTTTTIATTTTVDDPKPSLEGRGEEAVAVAVDVDVVAVAEVAQEPEVEPVMLAEPVTVTPPESPAQEPIPEVEQGEAWVEADCIAEEPEPLLEGMVKADDIVAEEPETPLEWTVKADCIAEEPETPLEWTVKVEDMAEEPEPPLEGTVKADYQVADAPEASWEWMDAEDATAAEVPELKASSEEQTTAFAAYYYMPTQWATEISSEEKEAMDVEPLANWEPATSYEEGVMMGDDLFTDLIPLGEQGEGVDEQPPADPIAAAEAMEAAWLACESSMVVGPYEEDQAMTDDPTRAYELETAEPVTLAYEPEMAEVVAGLADMTISEASDDELADYVFEDCVMSEHRDDDQMLIDEPRQIDEHVDAEMAEHGELAAIQDAETMRAEAQRRAEAESMPTTQAALQDALFQHYKRQEEERAARAFEEQRAQLEQQVHLDQARQHEEAMRELARMGEMADATLARAAGLAERRQREEEEERQRDFNAAAVARPPAEEETRLLLDAFYAEAETAPAEEDSLLYAPVSESGPDAQDPDAEVTDSDESDTYLKKKDMRNLASNRAADTDSLFGDFSGDEGDSLFGDGPGDLGEDDDETDSEDDSDDKPDDKPYVIYKGLTLPRLPTDTTTTTTNQPARADHAPSAGGRAGSLFNFGPTVHQTTTPEPVLPVFQFDFRAEAPATAPTVLPTEVADAEPAPAEEAEPRPVVSEEPRAAQPVVAETPQAAEGSGDELDPELARQIAAELAVEEEKWANEEAEKRKAGSDGKETTEAQTDAADPKGKGKGKAKSKTEAIAAARARVALELRQQEEQRRQYSEAYEAARAAAAALDAEASRDAEAAGASEADQETDDQQTDEEPVEGGAPEDPPEEELFDPRFGDARAEAEAALAAAEAKVRAAEDGDVSEEE
ncbi:hypothetical protein B0I37DRAFT_434254 [Chaetomium sp. MPI-CAGE-AT-0009]|nr:hypothetical protein B0I37DRAFT_434254 [Chaetomium sp. MPI-CAGE-AT-0009]